MKKYYICFFLLAVFLAASILTGAYIYFYRPEHAQPVPGQDSGVGVGAGG